MPYVRRREIRAGQPSTLRRQSWLSRLMMMMLLMLLLLMLGASRCHGGTEILLPNWESSTARQQSYMYTVPLATASRKAHKHTHSHTHSHTHTLTGTWSSRR